MPESHGTAYLGGVEILFSVDKTGIQMILLKHCEAGASSVGIDLNRALSELLDAWCLSLELYTHRKFRVIETSLLS